jgi:hypothetical protein
MQQLDMALLSIPRLSIEVPPLNIAQLKSCLIKEGYTAKCFDLNIELYEFLNFDEWLEVDSYFQTDLRYTGNDVSAKKRDIMFDEMHEKKVKKLNCTQRYLLFLEEYIDYIVEEYNPRIIGISVFSVNSVLPCMDLCKIIKRKYPDTPILLGGMGVSSFGVGSRPNFGGYMVTNKLADYFITGEGEEAIIKFMQEQKSHVVTPQIDDLDKLPYPIYDDFDFSKYPGNTNLVYTTGSRGCVRNCSFCDIRSLWKKYRYRSAEHILGEMIEIHKMHGTKEFYFTDSLINGSLKTFKELCRMILAKKASGDLPDDLMWGGQWITRPKGSMLEEDYRIAAESGLYNLSIGFESGSTQVLESIGKGVKREDCDAEMEMLYRYGIRCNMLMIVGYPTETLEDFEQTLDMFRKYKKYSDAGIIWGVNLGKTLVILPGALLGENPSHYGVEFEEDGNWINRATGLDYKERVRRRVAVQELCEELGFVIKSTVTTINSLHTIVLEGGYDSIS